MYFSVFQFYDHLYANDENEICLICWMYSEVNNPIQLLSDFTFVSSKCKCNPKIHSKCLEQWIYKTSSCPICRTKLTLSSNKLTNNYHYLHCFKYALNFLQICCYISYINLLFVVFHIYDEDIYDS